MHPTELLYISEFKAHCSGLFAFYIHVVCFTLPILQEVQIGLCFKDATRTLATAFVQLSGHFTALTGKSDERVFSECIFKAMCRCHVKVNVILNNSEAILTLLHIAL